MKTDNPIKPKTKIFIIWGLFISAVILVLVTILLLFLQLKPQSNIKTNPQQDQETYNKILNKINQEVDKLTKPSNENMEEILAQEIKELKSKRLTLSALYFSIGRTGDLDKQKEVIQKMDEIDKLVEAKNKKIILIKQDKKTIKSTEKTNPVVPRQRG